MQSFERLLWIATLCSVCRIGPGFLWWQGNTRLHSNQAEASLTPSGNLRGRKHARKRTNIEWFWTILPPALPLPRTSSFCFGLFHLCIILWECWGRRRRPERRASPWRPLWGTRWWVRLLVCDRLGGPVWGGAGGTLKASCAPRWNGESKRNLCSND